MSTRAIIEIKDSQITHRIYCHNDGYPGCLGAIVKEFVELAPIIDCNFPGNKTHEAMENGYDPYKSVPNVAIEANKFAAALLGFLWQNKYTSTYLTNRNPEEEIKEKDGTDIEHLYKITLIEYKEHQVDREKDNRPQIVWFSYDYTQKKFVSHSQKAFENETK